MTSSVPRRPDMTPVVVQQTPVPEPLTIDQQYNQALSGYTFGDAVDRNNDIQENERAALLAINQGYYDKSKPSIKRTRFQNAIGNEALKAFNKEVNDGNVLFKGGRYVYKDSGQDYNFGNSAITGLTQDDGLRFRAKLLEEARKNSKLGVAVVKNNGSVDATLSESEVINSIKPQLAEKESTRIALEAGVKPEDLQGLSSAQKIQAAKKLKAGQSADIARLNPEFQLKEAESKQGIKESEANILNANERTKIQRDNLTAQVASNNADRALRAQEFNKNYALQLQQAQSQAEYNTAQLQAQIEQSRLLNEQANLDRERLNASDEREYRFRLKELEQRRFDDIFNAIGNLNLY